MKKLILAMAILTLSLNAWETTTHRAIDRKAIENGLAGGNLIKFVENSGIPTNNDYYNSEEFEGYGTTYIRYIENTNDEGEGNGISQWGQTFSGKPSFQNMIEAGTMLEDAKKPQAFSVQCSVLSIQRGGVR